MDRQVYEQKINDQRFLIETLKAVNDKLRADIGRMATQIDKQNKEIKRLKRRLEETDDLITKGLSQALKDKP